MRAVSKKRAQQNRLYLKLRREYLDAHPRCGSPWDCHNAATEIQHRRGRRGLRLLDVEWWAPSCHECNMRAETDTGEALRLGWLVRIEGVA